MAEVPLAELMAAIGVSVNEAQNTIEQQAAAQFCSYFTPMQRAAAGGEDNANEPPALRPEMTHFAVPRPDGKGIHKQVSVPNVTMMPHKAMNLDQVRVSLAITSCRMEGGTLRVEVDGQGRAANTAGDFPAQPSEDGARRAEHTRTDTPDDFMISPSGCQFPFAGRYGSAIELVFRTAPPPEGINRLNMEQVKILP